MRERGERLTRLHNNCSGKHAAMIALARHAGWGSAGYAAPGHPLQRRCLEEVARWTALAAHAVPHATDGCGVPSFALPLRAMALAYARLGAAAEGDPVGGVTAEAAAAARRLILAVRAEPFLLAGSHRLDTALLEATGGRVIAKVGAEGVYCATIPVRRLGLALKIEDGATRAAGPALLGLLEAIAPDLAPNLAEHRSPTMLNTLGAVVGRITARVELHRDA
jgi:L-asparaginase II